MIGKRLKYFVRPGTGEVLSFLTKQYYIFEDGRVFDNARKRYLKQHELHGYLTVNLRVDNGEQKSSIRVHNLVASVFIRLLNNGENCHHISHDRKDNRLGNIEIIDAKEHVRMHWADGTMNGHGEKVAAKLSKQVAQLDKNGNLIHVWQSANEAGRSGFYQQAVSACCRGCYSTHRNNVYKGFKWMLYEDYLAQQPTAQQRWEARQLHLAF